MFSLMFLCIRNQHGKNVKSKCKITEYDDAKIVPKFNMNSNIFFSNLTTDLNIKHLNNVFAVQLFHRIKLFKNV